MNRRHFLRSAILTAVGLATAIKRNPFEHLPRRSLAARRKFAFQVSTQVLHDQIAFDALLASYKRDHGFDVAMEVGFQLNNFAQNQSTVVLYLA